MRTILIIILLFACLLVKAQRDGSIIIVNNEAWNCGGFTPKEAKVVSIKGGLYVRFVFDESTGKLSYKSLKRAMAFWKWEGTRIIKIKNQ